MTNTCPVFIIGIPRSGTKLLRVLLNNHPDVSLGSEGNFIPVLLTRFGIDADVSSAYSWREIYQVVSQTTNHQVQKDQGFRISEQMFIKTLNTRAESRVVVWRDIFEVLLRTYSPKPDAPIFGDKSHSYIRDVERLRTVFDDVRFLYIVRDPRDQALSALKVWGRSPLRSAHHWFNVAQRAERLQFSSAADVLTVRYEDLTADTDTELRRICEFLGLSFNQQMSTLKQPAERFRPGYGLNEVTKQHAKYREGLSPHVVKRVSEVTLPYLNIYGYAPENARRHRKTHKVVLKLLSYLDGLSMLRYHAKDKGLLAGIRYYLKRHGEARLSR